MGQNFVDQQCSTFGHAPGTTARTKSAVLATERHQMLSVTGVTAHSQESVFQPTTLKIVFKFLPEVIRQHPVFNGTLRLKSRSISWRGRHKIREQAICWTSDQSWRIHCCRHHYHCRSRQRYPPVSGLMSLSSAKLAKRLVNRAAPAGVSRPVALRAPSRETPAEEQTFHLLCPLRYSNKQSQIEATSILTQGADATTHPMS